AFRARTVVPRYVDDQGVVQFAHIFYGLDDAPDLVVRVSQVGSKDIGLFDKQLLLFPAEGIPLRQILRPLREFRVLWHDPQSFLIGKDGFAYFVPALVEQMHIADLL